MKQLPGGLRLSTIDTMAQSAGIAATGTSGLDALLAQPLNILTIYLPQEKKDDLANLMEELN